MSNGNEKSSYADAGVDTEAGERAVDLMRSAIAKSTRSEVVGDFGGFAGLFDISAFKTMTKPLLATSTDGVGTKIDVARRMDIHDTVGIDLVAMVVDDLVVCGAQPLFMTDYIAVGKVHPELEKVVIVNEVLLPLDVAFSMKRIIEDHIGKYVKDGVIKVEEEPDDSSD